MKPIAQVHFINSFLSKKSSNPCAVFIFECYFATILIDFLIYCGNGLTMFHSSLIKFQWEKTGDGEGEDGRGGEEGEKRGGHGAMVLTQRQPQCHVDE